MTEQRDEKMSHTARLDTHPASWFTLTETLREIYMSNNKKLMLRSVLSDKLHNRIKKHTDNGLEPHTLSHTKKE